MFETALNPENLVFCFLKPQKFTKIGFDNALTSKTFMHALEKLPEILVADKNNSALLSRKMKKGKIRKLASRLYTTNLTDPPELIVKRNLWEIVSVYFPRALVADRTALEYKPASDGAVFVVSTKKRAITLPGLNIVPRKGLGPIESDKPFIGGLYLSSQSRAFLENFKASRTRSSTTRRTLTRGEIEEKLDALLRHSGEQALKILRDDVRVMAPKFKIKKESKTLDALIGTMLGTKKSELCSSVGRARVSGLAFDPDRAILFQLLFEALTSIAPTIPKAFQEAW